MLHRPKHTHTHTSARDIKLCMRMLSTPIISSSRGLIIQLLSLWCPGLSGLSRPRLCVHVHVCLNKHNIGQQHWAQHSNLPSVPLPLFITHFPPSNVKAQQFPTFFLPSLPSPSSYISFLFCLPTQKGNKRENRIHESRHRHTHTASHDLQHGQTFFMIIIT